MTQRDVDVLVVGAGPTGLALALQVHDHGARVRVVERRARAPRPSRALIVHPRTLEVLRPLGVIDDLLSRGSPSPSVRLHLGHTEIAATLGDFALRGTPFPYLLFVGQKAVEDILARALASRGVEVEYGAELVGAHVEHPGAVAQVRRAGGIESVGCRFVAGCDGPTSIVRRVAGIGWRGGPCRQEVAVADLEIEGDLTPGVAHAVAGRNGLLFLFALGEGATWRLLATRTASRTDGPAGQPAEPIPHWQLQDLLDGAGLAAQVGSVAWSARIPLEHRIAPRYRSGPLFLVGDAAHVHSPAGGQGMNTGIHDATNLGWKLAFAATFPAGDDVDPLLDSYGAERSPVAKRVVALTRAIFWAEAHTDPLATFLRGVVVRRAAPLVPVVLRRRRLVAGGVGVLSQLGTHYRGSVLSLPDVHRGRNRPRAGDRLPDEAVEVAGTRQSLHALLARPGVHVLFEREAPPLDLAPLDGRVHLWRIGSWPGAGVVIVRPDGYVGYHGVDARRSEILSWLALVAAGRSPGNAAARPPPAGPLRRCRRSPGPSGR